MGYSHKSSHLVGLIHILIYGTDICTVHILHYTYTHYIIQYTVSRDAAAQGLPAHRATFQAPWARKNLATHTCQHGPITEQHPRIM